MIFKTSKMVVAVIGLAFLSTAVAYGSDSNKEIKMADTVVFPRPETPMISADPFVPLVTGMEPQTDEGTQEFTFSDLKLKGIIILENQACALVENNNVIKKYSKGDTIEGFVIQDITTKGVQFENNGKEIFLANPVR